MTQYEKNKELIRNKMSEVEKNNVFYQNILKLRNCDFKNEPWKKLIKIFTEINGVDEPKKLIRYLFMNYESYFVHLNALLGNIAPESSDSSEISNTKKLVIEILKSSTEENKFDGVKIINKVVSKINLEDVSDSSSILNSVVKTFVDVLDVPSLEKIKFSELQTDVLEELLKKHFDDIPAEPYSDLILNFNLVEEKITKFDVNGNTNDLENLKQKQARIFYNIVAVNNLFIDRGIEEKARTGELQLRYPLWRFLSVDLVTAETNITKLEGTDQNGRQYTREAKLATMKSSLSDMDEPLQECMSKLNKNNPIYSALTDIQTTLKQWNKINDSIKPINGLIYDRLDKINYNIGEIRKKKSLKKQDVENLTNRMVRTKKVLETLSKDDIKQELTTIETKINDLQNKMPGETSNQKRGAILAEIQSLRVDQDILTEAEKLKTLANEDKKLKGILDKLKNQLGQYITKLSNINDVIGGAALDDFLKSFDILEEIKGELQAKTDPSNDKLLELYFGGFKDKLVSYCKVFKDMKLKDTLHGVLQSVEPKLIEMFTTENKPINYDVLRLDENLYYSKAKSYFFNQINRLKLNMSAIRKCLLDILLSVDKNNKGEVDKYNEIVKRFVQFNAGTDDTGGMEALGRSNFEFTDEKGDVGSSLSVKQISELGIINMIEGVEEYTPDFMWKNLHHLMEYCSEINGADNAKYNKLKELGIQNLAFKSVESGKSKVILESYFNEKKLFDNRSYAQLVFNTFRDIKFEQLDNLDLQFGKKDSYSQMSDGVIAQNFYLLLEKVYNETQNGKSIAGALSDLPIDDMKALAFLLGDWIAGNSDFYRKHGFNEICNIIKDRIMFGCQGQMINGALKPKLSFTDKQINALVAHTFLISKKFSDRLDEIGKINSEDIYKKILPMLLEKDSNEKFTLKDLSTIQSYSVKTDYVYGRIREDVYKGKAIDHEQGHDAILDCFSQPLSDVMKYLLDNMDPKPSLADLLEKVHGECLKKDLPDGMWWQSIPKRFIQSELKNMFRVSKKDSKDEKKDEISDRIRTLDGKGGFIELTKRYGRYKENLDFDKKEIADISRDLAVYYNDQISACRTGNLTFSLNLIDLLSLNGDKDLDDIVFNELIERCERFDAYDVKRILDFFKKRQGTQNVFLNSTRAAHLIFKGNCFTYGELADNSLVGYGRHLNDNNGLSCCDRFNDLMKEFSNCKCMTSMGKLSLIDYIKIINYFFYRDMFCMLLDAAIKNHDRYTPINVEKNKLLNYEYLGNILDAEFSDTNWNNILDDLYRSGFKLTRDFGDSLSQLLKSSITNTKAKDSDTFKDLPSRLCDVYSVFKISLHECNSIENIEGMFDTMKGSDPLKVAIDNGQISFSESKVLTMKLLAALRAKENRIAMDCKIEKGEVKRGLTNKSFITILKYLSEEGKEDQNYFDVQDKSPQKQDFKKDFDLVVKYVVDNFDNLFSGATSESCSSDFNNVVSFLNRFSAVVPKEHLEQQLSQLRNRLKVPVKNITVFSNIQPPKVSTDIKTETEKIDSSTNNQITDVTNDIENKNVIDVTPPTTENTEKNSTNPQSSKVLTTESLTNYQNQINLAIVDTNSKSITSIQPKEGTEKLTNIDIELNKTTDIKANNDQKNSEETNQASGIGYAIPVILTFISLILWAISVYLGFPLPWTIGSGIVTTVTSVSWIIKLSIKSPEDEFLPMLNEKTDEQSLDLVKNISHEHADVPEQAVGDNQKDESTSRGK